MTIQHRKSIRKRYSPEQEAQIVLAILKEEQTLAQISARSGVHINQLRKWKPQAMRATEAAYEQG